MILNCQFYGFDSIAGRELMPGIFPMKNPRPVDMPQVGPAEWHGETFCTGAILRQVAGRILHLRAYLRVLNQTTGRTDRVMFFLGTADLWDNVIEFKPAPIENGGGPESAGYQTITTGGVAVIIRPRIESPGLDPAGKSDICRGCPAFLPGPPAACDQIRCCGKNEPDPERYGMMIQHDYGWCPMKKWGGADVKRAPRLTRRQVELNGKSFEAV